MSITFYSMGKRCGFCVKAEALLAPQIASGDIVKKPASEAKGKFNGFPAFEYNGKTHTGCPQSFEHLSKKLGYSKERYHHPGHNPYGYNAMPVRATKKLPLCEGDQFESLIQSSCENNQNCQKCVTDLGTKQNCNPITMYNVCDKSGGSSKTAKDGCGYSKKCSVKGNVGDLNCCDTSCGKNNTECIYACEQPWEYCGGHISPPDPGPDGPVVKKSCSSFPGCPHGEGQITLDGGQCVCGTGGQSFSNLPACCTASSGKAGLCSEYNCPVGGKGGGGGGGGAKKCSTDDNCGGSNQYCSAKSKECMEVPSTWTQDFYNSHLSSLPSSIPNQAKRCLMNGIAAKYPNPRNVKKDKTTLNEIMNNCKGNPKVYPTPKFSKALGGSGGKGDKCTVGAIISGCPLQSSLYCSPGSKTCKAFPSTWTQDFYDSMVDVVGALQVPNMKMNEDVAKCMINGVAKECKIKNPQKFNPADFFSGDKDSCAAKAITNCTGDPTFYPTSPVKGTSGGKKGISGGEIALIVVGSLALLVLVGVITYYFTHKKK